MDAEKKPERKKFKSLIVWNLLLKRTDENHALSITEIQDMLAEYGLSAERHSISRDIQAITDLLQQDQNVAFQERDLLNYEIEYDPALHGYKISQRPYEFDDLRLLAECIHSSKFISHKQEAGLLSVLENFCSEAQMQELQSEVYVIGRAKTANRYLMGYMVTIHQAIRENRQISFQYQKYTLQDRSAQVERRNGAAYIYSPFKMIINDGNYYLLAYDNRKQNMRTFRLDRMKGVKMLDGTREGEELFANLDLGTYTQRVFSMFSGERKQVGLRFINPLLDTVIDRFGTGAQTFYKPDDDRHFIVTTDIEISDQFYGWVAGFRKKAKIVSPPEVVEGFQNFLQDIQGRYENE